MACRRRIVLPIHQPPGMADSPPFPASRWSAHDAQDAALLQRIAGGNRAAFEALYRTYFTRLGRFLQRMLRRPPLIEEVINDTMYVVWQRAGSYTADSKASTWIFGIAYRRALKALAEIDDPVEADDAEEPHDESTAADSLFQSELRLLLNQAIARMTAEHRAVIELTYFHGCPYREIAQIMGCPVETVKTRMFYARRRLRDLLDLHRKDLPWSDESSIS
jgi:RNA polymerase sigma-70 factor (ECF subfamily)